MYIFTVSDMTCEHCAGAVEEAVKRTDPTASVSIDLPAKNVRVETKRSAQEIADAFSAAGYTGTLAA